MVRKERRTVTKEYNDLVINMVELNSKKLKDVASLVNLDRQVIRSILKKHQQGEEYLHPSIKRKKTWQDKNQIMSSIEHTINSKVALYNPHTQKELAHAVQEVNLSITSQSTVCRKLKSLGL